MIEWVRVRIRLGLGHDWEGGIVRTMGKRVSRDDNGLRVEL